MLTALFAGLPASRLPGFWYDQEEGEWVALLQGTAHAPSRRVDRSGDADGLARHVLPGEVGVDAHQQGLERLFLGRAEAA